MRLTVKIVLSDGYKINAHPTEDGYCGIIWDKRLEEQYENWKINRRIKEYLKR